MSNAGRMATHLHTGRHETDWRRADEWRRLRVQPDVAPLPAVETRPRFRVATILRLIPRHA